MSRISIAPDALLKRLPQRFSRQQLRDAMLAEIEGAKGDLEDLDDYELDLLIITPLKGWGVTQISNDEFAKPHPEELEL